jgi:hypothetical protein
VHSEKYVVYKVKRPLKAVRATPTKHPALIPAGSVLVCKHGDGDGELASVSWLGQRVLINEADLFMHCERSMGDPGTLV